jgi:hypothetical protein
MSKEQKDLLRQLSENERKAEEEMIKKAMEISMQIEE